MLDEVAILRTCPNMTLYVEWDVKPQQSTHLNSSSILVMLTHFNANDAIQKAYTLSNKIS